MLDAMESACCPDEAHAALKADPATFRAGTYPIGDAPDGNGGRLRLVNCRVCDSTLAAPDDEPATEERAA